MKNYINCETAWDGVSTLESRICEFFDFVLEGKESKGDFESKPAKAGMGFGFGPLGSHESS